MRLKLTKFTAKQITWKIFTSILWLAVVSSTLLAAAILFGGPKHLPALVSVNEPFKNLDYSTLPAIQKFQTRNGSVLAYRHYSANRSVFKDKTAVVLVHGSSASSISMHHMAWALQLAGHAVYSLDVRGHGESGAKLGRGRIDYVGQLEDDLFDFMQHAKTLYGLKRTALAGFSSGGGFVLRVAGSSYKELASQFDHYVLIAPFIS